MRNRFVIVLAAVVGAVFVAWFVFLPKESARVATDAGARVDAAEPSALPPPEIVKLEPKPTATSTTSIAPTSSATAIADDAAPPPPEPIPELDAFLKVPPGSDRWTPDEKQNYKDGLFESLARKEALLERELAAGDAKTKEQKRVTLEYLRARRAEILAGTRTRPPRVDAEP